MTTMDTPPPDGPDTGEGTEAADATASEADAAAPDDEPFTDAARDYEERPSAGPRATRFWSRPYIERYLVPFLLPLIVIVGVVMFVLNISRIFLSTHGDVDVIIGVGILLIILIGAAILSAAPRMQSSSLALAVGLFVVAILIGGWFSIGASEPESEGAGLAAEGPASQAFTFESSNALVFTPDAAQAATGISKITLRDASGEHTFHFEDPKTLMDTLHVTETGDTVSARAYFPAAGDYVFYCTIPGHREAGMEGKITVAGPAISLAEAESKAQASPVAESGGGGAGGATPTSAGGAGGATTTSAP
jgi:plastocyanin